MSFPYPQSTSPFASPNQHPIDDNNYWRASANRSPGSTTTTTTRLPGYGLSQQASGLASPNRLSPFFNSQRTLPMYKDKPYFAPRRTGPRSKRRKTLYSGIGLFLLLSVWYYMSGSFGWGGFGVKTPDSAKGAELWDWVQSLGDNNEEKGSSSKVVDWEARREKVRDAFIVSWDGYEKYGWGEFFSSFLADM